jgi:hypothetical protein
MAPPGQIFRFRGRTLSDAARRAFAELGRDVVIVDVRSVKDETGVTRTELVVSSMDKVGIPSLVDFLKPVERDDRLAPGPRAAADERWPARYARVWETLVSIGVREEQATILVREAWNEDEALDALPWRSVREILEQHSPCSPPLDLSSLQVLGIIGQPFTGRSTVAGGLCRMASEIIPERVALLTPQEPVMPGDGVEVIGFESAEEAALAVSRLPDVRLVVIDLPAPRQGEPRLGMSAWWRMFPEMMLVPVVDAMGPPSEALGLIRHCKEQKHTGWLMTGVDDDTQLGPVVSLALGTHGPLGIQGKQPHDIPRIELASWSELVDRMSECEEEAPTETGEALVASSGGSNL